MQHQPKPFTYDELIAALAAHEAAVYRWAIATSEISNRPGAAAEVDESLRILRARRAHLHDVMAALWAAQYMPATSDPRLGPDAAREALDATDAQIRELADLGVMWHARVAHEHRDGDVRRHRQDLDSPLAADASDDDDDVRQP